MYCDQCGAVVSEEANFCGECGNKISPEIASQLDTDEIQKSNSPQSSAKRTSASISWIRKHIWMLLILLVLISVSMFWYMSRITYENGVAAYEKQNYEQAYRNWKPLAEKGDSLSQFRLAGLYLYGEGVEKNPETAFYWMNRSATEKGYFRAMFMLGQMYASGTGVSPNGFKAAYWQTKAAYWGVAEAEELVDKNASVLMAVAEQAYINLDYQSAFQVFEYFSEKGYPRAQVLLGRMYMEGQGTQKNVQKALDLYKASRGE